MGQQAVQFDFESVQMDRGGMGRRFDRPCSGAHSDAHTAGYPVAEGVNVSACYSRQVKCWKIAMPNKLHTPAMDRQVKCCWEANRWIAVELGGQLATIGDDWRWLASSGGWRRLTQDGTDVESPSGVPAELHQRTGRQFVRWIAGYPLFRCSGQDRSYRDSCFPWLCCGALT